MDMRLLVEMPAHAKVNLTLAITGRRPDGLHTLDSIMHSVDLADRVALYETGDGRLAVRCDHPDVPENDSNLAAKAAAAFFSCANIPCPGLLIDIDKRIPVTGGLGGGSADAAAVLNGLNGIYGRPLSASALIALAHTVGSDVPFCLTGGCARVTGTGEEITPLPPLGKGVLVLVSCGEKASTGEMYRRFDEEIIGNNVTATNTVAIAAPMSLALAIAASDLPAVGALLYNRFEAFYNTAALAALMMANGALGTCLSGSGPTFFGLFADRATAERSVAALDTAAIICGLL